MREGVQPFAKRADVGRYPRDPVSRPVDLASQRRGRPIGRRLARLPAPRHAHIVRARIGALLAAHEAALTAQIATSWARPR